MTTSSPSHKQLREFGLLIGIVFPVVFGWLGPSLRGHSLPVWPFVVGVPALVLGLVLPRALAWPYRGWMALGHVLGWVNSHIILGLVFVLVVQPIALIKRLFGSDPLRRQFEAKASYREPHTPGPIDLKRIF
ncbi:MAG: SxtJ family membrane protein [Synechococcaceae cyanobacterium ELA445]